MALYKNLYTLKDLVAEECAPIFEANNDGVAMRMFQHTAIEQQIPHDDFRLIRIGRIDKTTGEIIPETPSEVIINVNMDLETFETELSDA